MGLRSAASVAIQAVKRGAGALGVDDFMWLQENSGMVKEVKAEIDKRADAARDIIKEAAKAMTAADDRLANAEAAETTLKDGNERAEKHFAKTEAKHQADMDVLGPRTRAVIDKEAAANAREIALNNRDQKSADMELDRETEFQAREATIEAREAAADARDEAHQVHAAALETDAIAISTAAKMMNQINMSLAHLRK